MRPLGITDVKNTSLYINSTMQVTSKLTPCYFLRHVSLHPAIKCCRLIRKHKLRFEKNNYLGRDSTFSFWSLNTSRAPVSFVPFSSSGSFETCWAHRSSASFCPRRPNSPYFTFFALDSLRSCRP